jgi:type IV pilus assembly protein PilN
LIRINLLPKNLRKRQEPSWWRLIAIALPVVVLLVLIFLQLGADSQLSSLQAQVTSTQNQLNVLQPFVAERSRLLAEQRNLLVIAGIQKKLSALQSPWSEDLARFARQIPRGSVQEISLQNLSMTPTSAAPNPSQFDGHKVTKQFSMQGTALTNAALVRFLNSFEDSKIFSVQFQSASRSKGGRYSFSALVGMNDVTPSQATGVSSVR